MNATKRTWLGVAAGMVSLVPMAGRAAENAAPAATAALAGTTEATSATGAVGAEISADARLAPVMERIHDHDFQVGYRVMEVKSGTPFARLGLKKGDVLKSINGLSLDSAHSLDVAYNQCQLGRGMNIVVDLVREGQEQAFVYSIP